MVDLLKLTGKLALMALAGKDSYKTMALYKNEKTQ